MPVRTFGFPVGTTNIRLVDKYGVEYPVTVGTDTFTRTGENGALVCFNLYTGDKFNGEILSGEYGKQFDSNMTGFTASIQSGKLSLTGKSDSGGTARQGSITGNNPLVMMDEMEFTISMQSPTDDAGLANRDIYLMFYIVPTSTVQNPESEADFFQLSHWVDDTGILLRIRKEIAGASSNEATGYDYTMDTTRAKGAYEATIWRVVFHGKPGTSGAHIHVYLKQSDTIANAELATENEVTGSPFDTDNWRFHVGYPAFRLYSKNTTYFGSTLGSASAGLIENFEITYPDFHIECEYPDTGRNTADVELWDGNPSSGGVRVLSQSHVFSGNVYLENGLNRIIFNLSEQYLQLWSYVGSNWRQYWHQIFFYLTTNAVNLSYPELLQIIKITPEEAKLKIRFHDTASADSDYYVDVYLTQRRGSYSYEIEVIEDYPVQAIEFRATLANRHRFGYSGNGKIGDVDLVISGQNTTMGDNFLVGFDDDWAYPLIAGASCNQKADTYVQAYRGSYYYPYSYTQADIESGLIFTLFQMPYSLVANLFVEAESASITASVREYADATHHGFTDESDMICDAQPSNTKSDVDDDADPLNYWNDGVISASVTQSNETTIVKYGSKSLKMVLACGGAGHNFANHQFAAPTDFSSYDYYGYWFYGTNSGETYWVYFYTGGAGASFMISVTDDYAGWKWVCLKFSDFTDNGAGDWTQINNIYFQTGSANTETWYLDWTTVYDGLWESTLNSTHIINNTANKSVGTYCTAITSVAAGAVRATVLPITPLGKLSKFDTVKFYATGTVSSTKYFWLIDADGDYVRKTFSLGGQVTLDIPHNSADLTTYGWTETGTFNFSTLTSFRVSWTADAGGEIMYIDDLHEYIGTTTTRGRGETLSGGSAAVLDVRSTSSTEYVSNQLANDLPFGKFLLVIRAKCTDGVASAFHPYTYNDSELVIMNESNAVDNVTLTTSFDFYTQVFDVLSTQISDTYRNIALKYVAVEDTMFIDYFLIIPLSDGRNLPMDIAHEMLRTANVKRRACDV